MKKTVSKYEFMNDSRLTNNFSYHGLEALFEHLEDWEESCGQELEYDPVAIRCDFTEFNDLDEVRELYYDLPEVNDNGEEESLEWLRDRTSVIEFGTSLILQVF